MPAADIEGFIADMHWRRSAYTFIGSDRPTPIVEILTSVAKALASTGHSLPALLAVPATRHAGNLVRRLGDTELFRATIETETKSPDQWRGAAACGSLLVAYFSAVKALLDAIAILLNDLNKLGLTPKEQDFGKGTFWNRLNDVAPGLAADYQPHRSVISEMIRWRDAAVHRLSPLVVVNDKSGKLGQDVGEGPKSGDVEVRMAMLPDTDLDALVEATATRLAWVSPAHFPIQWAPKLVELAALAGPDLCRLAAPANTAKPLIPAQAWG